VRTRPGPGRVGAGRGPRETTGGPACRAPAGCGLPAQPPGLGAGGGARAAAGRARPKGPLATALLPRPPHLWIVVVLGAALLLGRLPPPAAAVPASGAGRAGGRSSVRAAPPRRMRRARRAPPGAPPRRPRLPRPSRAHEAPRGRLGSFTELPEPHLAVSSPRVVNWIWSGMPRNAAHTRGLSAPVMGNWRSSSRDHRAAGLQPARPSRATSSTQAPTSASIAAARRTAPPWARRRLLHRAEGGGWGVRHVGRASAAHECPQRRRGRHSYPAACPPARPQRHSCRRRRSSPLRRRPVLPCECITCMAAGATL
jgi:hypothetical protein